MADTYRGESERLTLSKQRGNYISLEDQGRSDNFAEPLGPAELLSVVNFTTFNHRHATIGTAPNPQRTTSVSPPVYSTALRPQRAGATQGTF